jgi:hypothetical protein
MIARVEYGWRVQNDTGCRRVDDFEADLSSCHDVLPNTGGSTTGLSATGAWAVPRSVMVEGYALSDLPSAPYRTEPTHAKPRLARTAPGVNGRRGDLNSLGVKTFRSTSIAGRTFASSASRRGPGQVELPV